MSDKFRAADHPRAAVGNLGNGRAGPDVCVKDRVPSGSVQVAKLVRHGLTYTEACKLDPEDRERMIAAFAEIDRPEIVDMRDGSVMHRIDVDHGPDLSR